MEARLVPIAGGEGASEFALRREAPLVLGRGDSVDVQLLHGKISRQHCRISFENGFYYVEDLSSRNGTWVNGRRIHRAILFHHDRLMVGGIEMRFVLDGELSDILPHAADSAEEDMAFATRIKSTVESGPPASFMIGLPDERSGGSPDQLQKDLSVVYRVIHNVNAEHNLDQLLETVMDSVMEANEPDRGYLIAARRADGALTPLVSRNREGVPESIRNRFSRSVVSECLSGGYSVLMADPALRSGSSESIVIQQIQSIMCVPMCDESVPVGVIYVDRIAGSDPFTERDLKVLTAIAHQAATAIRRAQLARKVETLFRDAMRTVIRMVEVKDEYTYGHSERVTAVALLLADLTSLDDADRRTIELAGLLHDVGKLGVDLNILRKPGPLSDAEYERIKRHPVEGAAVLRQVENAEAIADAVRHHHERWDGKGYPDGLSGEEIAVPARILALADAYDSMVSGRPYKAALPPDEIVREIRAEAGKQFWGELALAFVNAIEHDERFRRRLAALHQRGAAQEPASGD